MKIRPYASGDEKAVIELWRKCNLTRPQNNPKLDIERKLKVNPELFLVGLMDSKVVAAVMGGYDGHRGWIYYLGVDPALSEKRAGAADDGSYREKDTGYGLPQNQFTGTYR